MNKKGFTMIELLAVIVIMGILSTVAIISVSRYLNKANNSSYETMIKTLYEESQNYLMDHLDLIDELPTTITSNELLSGDYIDKLIDPKNKKGECSGNVVVSNNSSSIESKLKNLTYKVTIKCGNTTKSETYPK